MERRGKKSVAQTPAPKKDRIYGSERNPKGSASSSKSASKIELSESIINTLENKRDEYNAKHPNGKVTLATLKAVFRRGAGAYSSSHRPTITGGRPNSRSAWAFARVNKFLLKKGGTKVKAAYVQDDDLMERGGVVRKKLDGNLTKLGKEKYIVKGLYKNQAKHTRELKNILSEKGLKEYSYEVSPSTKSYYLEYANDKCEISIRLSNHTKASIFDDGEYEFIDASEDKNGYLRAEIYICSNEDFEDAKKWIRDNVQDDDLMDSGGVTASNGEKSNLTPIFQWVSFGVEQEDGSIKYFPSTDFYLWIYDDIDAEKKLKSGIYDYAYSDMNFGDNLELIWDDFKKYKGNEHIVGFIIGEAEETGSYISSGGGYRWVSDGGYKGVEIGIMTTRQNFRRKGINQFAIKYLRDKFKLDKEQVSFYMPTQEGKLFISSNKYALGGLLNALTTGMENLKKNGIVLSDNLGDIIVIAYNTGNQEISPSLYNKALIYKSVQPIKSANEIIQKFDLKEFERFSESKIEDYKKSHLIIMNQNEMVYDSNVYAEGGDLGQEITCVNCGWHWNTNQSDEFDKYVCHKCGFDNRTFYDSDPIGKYHLGGDMSKHLAPNGKPSNLNHEQWHLVRTPEFKAWFGDWENDPKNASKVVDENGEPKVMYHGSRGDFNIFSNENPNKLAWTEGGLGFYFTTYSDSALGYGRRIIPSFINSRKIKKSDESEHAFVTNNQLNKLYQEGYDSIYFDGQFTKTNGQRGWKEDELVVFEPNQIKLADGSNTTFDANNPDIRYKNGGNIENEFDDLDNNQLVKTLKSFYSDLSESPIFEYLDLKIGDYTLNIGDNELVIFRKEPFSKIDSIKIGRFIQPYFDASKKPLFARFFDRYTVSGNNIIIKVKDMYNNGGYMHLGGDMSKHLAPNGKSSNLNHEQWHLVRTPEFKAWFGDWENDPKNASKVVDENGEPLVVYRGWSSNKKMSNIFSYDVNMFGSEGVSGRSKNRFGFYFSGSKSVAKAYAKDFAQEYNEDLDYKKSIKKRALPIFQGYFLNIRNICNITPSNPKFPTLQNTIEDSKKRNQSWMSFKEIKNRETKLYPTEIGVKSLCKIIGITKKEVEYISSDDDYLLRKYNSLETKSIYDYFINHDNGYDFWFRDKIQENNYDGIVFQEYTYWGSELTSKEIKEIEKKDDKYESEVRNYPNVFVSFEPNQIKIADGSNTTFDANNPDIRYKNGGQLTDSQTEALKFLNNPNTYAWSVNIGGATTYSLQIGIPTRGGKTQNIKGQVFKSLLENKFIEGIDKKSLGITDRIAIYKISEKGQEQLSEYKDGGLLKKAPSVLKIADKHNVDLETVDNALKKGIKVEMEHTKNKNVAKTIALHHLYESPKYYEKLKEMEKELNLDEHYEDIRKIYNIGGVVDPILSFSTPTGEPSKLTYLQQVLVRTSAFKKFFGDWEYAGNQFVKNGRQEYEYLYRNVSKVIDKITLEPKVVYHGTRVDSEFYVFDVSQQSGLGRPYGYFAHNMEYSENFTSSQMGITNGQPFLYKCFVNIRNPFYAMTSEYYDIQEDAEYWKNEISKTIALDKYTNELDANKLKTIKDVVESQIGKYIDDTFRSSEASFWVLMARDNKKLFKYFLNNYRYDGVFYAEEFSSNYDVDNPADFTEAVTIFEPSQVKLADGRNLNFDPMNVDIRYAKGGDTDNVENTQEKYNSMGKRENLRNLLLGDKYAEGGEVVANKLKDGNDGKKGGYFEGRSHAEGGIKAYNKDTGQMIEVEGEEVIITKGAVKDPQKREFEGEMLTNREILSRINQSGGGVSFARGGETGGSSCGCSGKKYKYGGEMMDDYSIVKIMNRPFEIINDNFADARAFADMLVNKLK